MPGGVRTFPRAEAIGAAVVAVSDSWSVNRQHVVMMHEDLWVGGQPARWIVLAALGRLYADIPLQRMGAWLGLPLTGSVMMALARRKRLPWWDEALAARAEQVVLR